MVGRLIVVVVLVVITKLISIVIIFTVTATTPEPLPTILILLLILLLLAIPPPKHPRHLMLQKLLDIIILLILLLIHILPPKSPSSHTFPLPLRHTPSLTSLRPVRYPLPLSSNTDPRCHLERIHGLGGSLGLQLGASHY